jgi:hypothetical protein
LGPKPSWVGPKLGPKHEYMCGTPNGAQWACTRLYKVGLPCLWPVRSDPRARTVYRGHVGWSKKPHLEPIWCPKHGNMCGTPNGAQWPSTRLHKVGLPCLWPVQVTRTVCRGHVGWSKKPHLETIWCPKHRNMCGTPNGAQWPCTRLHKVGWACVGARPR